MAAIQIILDGSVLATLYVPETIDIGLILVQMC